VKRATSQITIQFEEKQHGDDSGHTHNPGGYRCHQLGLGRPFQVRPGGFRGRWQLIRVGEPSVQSSLHFGCRSRCYCRYYRCNLAEIGQPLGRGHETVLVPGPVRYLVGITPGESLPLWGIRNPVATGTQLDA
jgi:hypothetical protein